MKIKVSIGNSRMDKKWRLTEMELDEFRDRIFQTKVTVETVAEFKKMPKAQQEELLAALVRKAKSCLAEAMSMEGSLDELPCDPKEYQERLRRFKALTRQHTQLTRNIRDLTAGR